MSNEIPIYKFDPDWNLVHRYRSANEAIAALGISKYRLKKLIQAGKKLDGYYYSKREDFKL